jgi:hypothetical protein
MRLGKARESIGYKVNDSADKKIKGQSSSGSRRLRVWEASVCQPSGQSSASVISAKSLDPDAPKLHRHR